MIDDHHTPISPCPACGIGLDGATSGLLSGRTPRADDFSLCSYCGEILCFAEGMTLRALVPADWLVLAAHPELMMMLRLMQRLLQDEARRREGP